MLHNKNLFIIIVVRFLFLLTFTMEVLNPIFAQYVMGNEAIASVLAMLISLPTILLAVLLPTLTRHFDKTRLLLFCMVLYAVTSVIQYFVGYENMPMFLAFTMIRAIGYGGVTSLMFMFVPDCIEYGQYTTGRRNAGTSFSLQTFVCKLNSAIISTVTAYVISVMGFSAADVTSAGQRGVWFTYTVFASVGAFIAIPIMAKCYKLRDKDVAIMIACNNGDITKDKAEECINGKEK